MSVVASEPEMPMRVAAGRLIRAPWARALLATAFLIGITLGGAGPSLVDWLGDTDDAVRLVSVRDLLAGTPWFDTTLPRIGAPEPLVSHWSRLIDLPLAALMAALAPVLGPERAELATRILWPALLFFALALLLAREAQRRAGAMAAAFVLVLVATSPMAMAQFLPGRIDHHNAQILCAVAGLILLARSFEGRRAGWLAGGVLGLGLAIGYEAIALVVPALGLAALVAVLDPERTSRAAEGMLRVAVAATAVLLAAFLATTAPERWLDVRCDTLALNLVALAACGTAGLGEALRFAGGRLARCAVLGTGAAAGALAYAALEPACMAGPLGQVGRELVSVWLDQVSETKSILWLTAGHPATGLALAAFVLAGAAAQVALWRRRSDAGTGLLTAFVVLAALLGCWQIKLLPYACWLAALPLAVWAAGLPGTASLSATIVRIAAVLLLGQTTLDAGFNALLSPLQPARAKAAATDVESADPRRPCFLSHNVRTLANLPPGLVAADIDLGPYIAALTPHRVVAAPYHRLETGILAGNAIINGQPEAARQRIAALGVAYVALCADRWRKPERTEASPSGLSLRALLLDGREVAFLQEIETPASPAVRVWRTQAGR